MLDQWKTVWNNLSLRHRVTIGSAVMPSTLALADRIVSAAHAEGMSLDRATEPDSAL